MQGKSASTDQEKVRLFSFAREEFDEDFEFLKKNCYIRRTWIGTWNLDRVEVNMERK